MGKILECKQALREPTTPHSSVATKNVYLGIIFKQKQVRVEGKHTIMTQGYIFNTILMK